MIRKITLTDRKRNPKATKGKTHKLVSKNTGRVLGYGTPNSLKKRERQVQTFKNMTL